MIFIDYMQLMSGQGGVGRSDNRQQEISYISRSLKALARELNVPVLAAAQLSRAVESRSDKRPMLSDLRESGCLTGDTLVYLPEEGIYTPLRELVGRSGLRAASWNAESGELEAASVSNSFCTGEKPVFELITEQERAIRATANHKFLTADGWKRLDKLQLQEPILTSTMASLPSVQPGQDSVGWDKVATIRMAGIEPVYDLTVPSNHNFVANNIIVHNSIEQDADVVLFIYREDYYIEDTDRQNIADVLIAKHRHGATGTVSLYFRKELTQFRDLEIQRTDLDY
jgi:replicative DNA helicase